MNESSIVALLKDHGFSRVEVRHPGMFHAFQVVGHKGRRGLSIVAGENLYSIPRCITSEFSEVEIGLLVDGHLRYCDRTSPFFAGDVEGYADEDKLVRIAESIDTLRLSRTSKCSSCGRRFEAYMVKDGRCFLCRHIGEEAK